MDGVTLSTFSLLKSLDALLVFVKELDPDIAHAYYPSYLTWGQVNGQISGHKRSKAEMAVCLPDSHSRLITS